MQIALDSFRSIKVPKLATKKLQEEPGIGHINTGICLLKILAIKMLEIFVGSGKIGRFGWIVELKKNGCLKPQAKTGQGLSWYFQSGRPDAKDTKFKTLSCLPWRA